MTQIRLFAVLATIYGFCPPLLADATPEHHFNYATLEYTSLDLDTFNRGTQQATGPYLRFAKNLGRFLHLRGELGSLGFESISLDQKSIELGVGFSVWSSDKTDLYLVASGLRSQLDGSLSGIISNAPAGNTTQSENFVTALFGYNQYLSPGVQALLEFKHIEPEEDYLDNSQRLELGLRIHPPNDDKLSLGIRKAFTESQNGSDNDELRIFIRIDF